MNNARCTEDGVTYSAASFSLQPSVDLERKRRLLQCPACSGPAFSRHAPSIGRAACFGARPHADGCSMATQDFIQFQDGAGEDQEPPIIAGGKIVVDFNYGAAAQPEHYGIGRAPNPERVGRNYGQPPLHLHHRRLSSLLRSLLESPAFGCSDHIIEIEGRGECDARNFFVPLKSATYHFSGHFNGYWGLISYAKLAVDNSLWFNSGGNDNISFCLDSQYVDTIFERYHIQDLEDLAGAYILVVGTPRVSLYGKLFCVIDRLEYMALRLT